MGILGTRGDVPSLHMSYLKKQFAPWIGAACLILTWALAGAVFNPSQLNDSWEQLVWAQHLEWGYWKHPPLTTWLMALPQHVWGPSAVWPYVLGGLCGVMTLVFTGLLASRVMPPAAVMWVALLFTLNNGFTRRAQVFNHNSVLVMLVAALAWRLVVALQTRRIMDWGWVGLCAGLALLTKYQAMLPVLCMGLVVVLTLIKPKWFESTAGASSLTSPRLQPVLAGLMVALAVTVLVLAPHVHWLWQHDGQTLKYADRSMDASTGSAWRDAAGLFVLQLRNWIPALVVLLLLALMQKKSPEDQPSGELTPGHPLIWGLVWLPSLALLMMAMLGIQLQSHWGMQTLQFVVLLLALGCARRWGAPTAKAWWLWAVLQCVGLVMLVLQMTGKIERHQADLRKISSKDIAGQVMSHWQAHCNQPLMSFEAPNHVVGMLLAHGAKPMLLIDADDPVHAQPMLNARQPDQHVLRLRMQAQAPDADWQLLWSPQQDWPQFKLWAAWLKPTGVTGYTCTH